MPPAARSVEELFPLIEFCKNGDLRASLRLDRQRQSARPSAGKKTRRASPLQIAIEKAFLTLTQILLDAGLTRQATETRSGSLSNSVDVCRCAV
jgi:hypothetical protein